jgi:malonyl-CoA O-methyltransferase
MNELGLDKKSLRLAFERAAKSYDTAAVLQNEVCERMLGRIEYIKHGPASILDAGSGTGNALAGLRKRYPSAHIVAFDLALGMLSRGRQRMPWWRTALKRHMHSVCGDIERLPFGARAFDMIWSNLTLQWVDELPRVFSDMKRVMAPGGLLMFSTFGPDTLRELREAYRDVDRYTHVNRFIDMHDIGDMLVHSGYGDPVMDMEHFTLTYENVGALMRELKAIGAHNVTLGRPLGLSGRKAFEAVARNYESMRREGRLPATFEVIYGHAWTPLPRTSPAGRPVIDIKSAR